MGIALRDAVRDDAGFIAWVLLTSHRSHLPKGLWDFSVSEHEPTCLRFLEALASSSDAHFAHYSTFLVVDRLLAAMLDRGRGRGAGAADIGVLIGNDPAQCAYEKAGFRVTGEKRHPEFEAVYGCPGIRSLGRSI